MTSCTCGSATAAPGRASLDSALAAAREAGASRCFLETESANVAVRFYARHGFTAEDSMWMQRPL